MHILLDHHGECTPPHWTNWVWIFVTAWRCAERHVTLFYDRYLMQIGIRSLGSIISALVEDTLGWHALYLIQSAIGALLALAAYAFAPQLKPDWSALKTDWVAIFLLSLSLATAILVISQ